MDDHLSSIGDWIPPSPNSGAFFASLFGDDGSVLTSASKSQSENRNDPRVMGSNQRIVSFEEKDGGQAKVGANPVTELGSFPEQRGSSRVGLAERIAARAGFNAPRLDTESIRSTDLSSNADLRSPYLTIPPGLSPTTLLDSPVFLSNSLAQPSPTTGKFPFTTNGNGSSLTFSSATHDRSKENFFEANNSSFAFKPLAGMSSSFVLGSGSKISQATMQPFPNMNPSVQSENTFQRIERINIHSRNTDVARSGTRALDNVAVTDEHSPPLDEQQGEEGDKKGSGDSMVGGAPAEDGYNWRKYGQKQVKGSEYPRSYYKCTHPNCAVKKKVERSHEGHITEIIYKGAHNHPKPPPNRRAAIGSSHSLSDMQFDNYDQAGVENGDTVWPGAQKELAAGASDWRSDNLEVTSSTNMDPEYCNPSLGIQNQNGAHFESGDAVDASSTFSNDEEEEDRGTHGSVSLGYDVEGDESESKRRKVEAYAAEMSGATRAIREPRVVVQTTSEVDILDDGYRWRKYGQKVVKGNPNPRSYYKCTSAGCTVRKHVERASHDLKSVITTYEGKHNHDVPAARNTSHVNSAASNIVSSQAAIQSHIHRSEPSQIHNSMARFERPNSLGSFSLPLRQQLGPHGFNFGMNQPGLTNLAMAGFVPGQSKMPMMPVHPYLSQQQQQANNMGFLMAKGEPKMEPVSDPAHNLSDSSSVYQQIMNRLPLGPQM